MTPLLAWQAWHHGDSVAPPLKLIDQLDICDSKPDRKGKMRPMRETAVRTFWNLKFLCSEFDRVAGIQKGSNPSISDLIALYNSQLLEVVLPSPMTQQNRVLHAEELNWDYAAVAMREQKKRRAAEME
jgi:hypothetical protein